MLVDAQREELTLVVDVVAEFVPEPLAVCCDLPVPLAVPVVLILPTVPVLVSSSKP